MASGPSDPSPTNFFVVFDFSYKLNLAFKGFSYFLLFITAYLFTFVVYLPTSIYLPTFYYVNTFKTWVLVFVTFSDNTF